MAATYLAEASLGAALAYEILEGTLKLSKLWDQLLSL